MIEELSREQLRQNTQTDALTRKRARIKSSGRKERFTRYWMTNFRAECKNEVSKLIENFTLTDDLSRHNEFSLLPRLATGRKKVIEDFFSFVLGSEHRKEKLILIINICESFLHFRRARGKKGVRRRREIKKNYRKRGRREKGERKKFSREWKWWRIMFHSFRPSSRYSGVSIREGEKGGGKKFGFDLTSASFHLILPAFSLIRIKFAPVTFQLVHVVTGGIGGRSCSSIEGFRTVDTGGLDRRTQVRQTAE